MDKEKVKSDIESALRISGLIVYENDVSRSVERKNPEYAVIKREERGKMWTPEDINEIERITNLKVEGVGEYNKLSETSLFVKEK